MFYKNFEDHITWKTGIVIRNWPLPGFRSPSEVASMAELDILQNGWTSGATHFYMLMPSEFREWQAEQREGTVEAQPAGHNTRAEGGHAPANSSRPNEDGTSSSGNAHAAQSQSTSNTNTHSHATGDSSAGPPHGTFVNSFAVTGIHGAPIAMKKRARKERSDKGKPRKKRAVRGRHSNDNDED